VVNVLKGVLNVFLGGVENLFTQAIIFYSIASFVLVLSAYSYSVLMRNEFFLYYKRIADGPGETRTSDLMDEDAQGINIVETNSGDKKG